jgi:hypothetical protein
MPSIRFEGILTTDRVKPHLPAAGSGAAGGRPRIAIGIMAE